MALDGIKYRVRMVDSDGGRIIEEVFARTPGLAVKAAEVSQPGYLAEALTIRKVGTCERCGTVLFEGATHTEQKAPGILFCGEC